MHHDIYDKAKEIVKKDVCIRFFNAARFLYLETETSGIGIGTGLLRLRDGMNCGHDEMPHNAILHPTAFTSKTFLMPHSATTMYNVRHVRILHGLEKIDHHSFMREVCVITNHKLLVAMLIKDITMLSQQL